MKPARGREKAPRPQAPARSPLAAAALLVAAAAAAVPGAGTPSSSAEPGDEGAGPARVQLAGPAGAPPPAAVRVAPDTVALGGAVWLLLDYPPGVAPPRPEEVRAPGGVARLTAPGRGGRPAALRPGAAEGTSVALVARLYDLGRVRLTWGEGPSAPWAEVVVVPRLPGDAGPAPLREPAGLGWRHGRLIALVAAAAAAAVATALLRRRRRAGTPDAPLSPPAYLATALALERLVGEGLPERGEGRLYLDRLSSLARAYLQARFGLPAAELTPAEIARGLVARGHAAALAGGWRDLLSACDARRYAPEAVPARICAEFLAQVVSLVGGSRVVARFTPVPPALAVAGELAWERLRADAPVRHGGAHV